MVINVILETIMSVDLAVIDTQPVLPSQYEDVLVVSYFP